MPQDVNYTNLIKKYYTVHATPQLLRCTDEFIRDLKTIPINKDSRLAAFDITDMYTNIPTTDLIQLLTQNSNKKCSETRK
jgi:hypothetical protein